MFHSHKDTVIEFVPKCYKEEDFVVSRGGFAASRKHSVELILHRSRSTWHVRVTLHAQWPENTTKLQRKKDVESICRRIRFDRIQPLRDTVTEVALSTEHDIATTRPLPLEVDLEINDVGIQLCGRWFYIREDPFRVRFPSYDFDSETPARNLSEVKKEQELAAGVHEARLIPDDRLYVYKEVDRPLYEPRDTDILEQELKNLKLVRGATFVVQLIGVVVSTNPYRTAREDGDDDILVLRGLLLEYHPNGTLEDVLRFSGHDVRQPWRRWAFQIASGLRELHSLGLTHMDLKPSNVVISAKGEAVLIDISGGAITQEWLSPEMRHLFSPCSQDFEARVQNDVWAFGKMLSQMGSVSSEDVEKELLNSVASLTDVSPRITLCDAISKLQP